MKAVSMPCALGLSADVRASLMRRSLHLFVLSFYKSPPSMGLAPICGRSSEGRLIVFIDDLAQAPRIGQLLSRRPQRIAHHRAQQVQERPKAPFDHRRLLEAGYPLVMS